MNQQLNGAWRCNRKTIAHTILLNGSFGNVKFFAIMLIMSSLFLISCQKEAVHDYNTEHLSKSAVAESSGNVLNEYTGLSFLTKWELQQARAATARYKNIENAKKDGYVDIGVVMVNMGHHFMKPSLVDATFDLKNPEILVYNKNMDGSYTLVAIEYAIPLELLENAPPGFSGNQDEWNRHTGFGLWLLHAWVWKYNPAGVFNPTNANVHTY
jgi:hypothetical protein